MPLDSDVANADAQLFVEFYENQTEPHKGRPFVRIAVPGDKTNIIDQPVREDHKRRFPRQWLYFQMQNTEEAEPIGTPILNWHQNSPEELTQGQMDELRLFRFQTVEQVAKASDSQLQRVGMGAVGLREKARTWLIRQSESKNTSQIEDLKAQIAALTALVQTQAQPAPSGGAEDKPEPYIEPVEEPKRGPGRPRKWLGN